ncbi:hypothetical protein LOD99_8361 [Oopsacas minuta]|uniref:Uncharacterized protein n=1 Tax=Oopsacas minuta TaxID=111878 RepID=A0AAV7JHI9_9METZ|nr:hypothetical protein LOD99_8361 [Oopsacas minuta]
MDQQLIIILADSGYSQVKIFSNERKLITKIGKEGSAPGEFTDLRGIAVYDVFTIITVDHKDHNELQAFSYLYSFSAVLYSHTPCLLSHHIDSNMMSKRSRATRDTEEIPPGPTRLFISYCHDPISLLPINSEQDDHLRKFRVEYEKARVCNLSQTLTDERIYVSVDQFGSEEKSDTWAGEQLKQCDYFIIVISESYFQFICQQHTCISLQTSLPKLRILENFVNELPNRTIVVSFTPDPNNIIPPVLADVNVIHLMDMPKLTLQKNFEQLLSKIRPGYDTAPEECVHDVQVTVTEDIGQENGEVTDANKEESAPNSDNIGELPAVEKKKREKPLQLKLFNNASELSVTRPRRSVATPLITPGIEQTSEMSIAGKKVIDLSYKDINELPLDLPYHEDLHVLWLSNNRLNHLEVVKLSGLNHLEELYAHGNQIQTYPIQFM